jgi:hypothetical protein
VEVSLPIQPPGATDDLLRRSSSYNARARSSRWRSEYASHGDDDAQLPAERGIGYGRHLEARESANIYVVSEALTRAAILERQVSHPCVAFDASVTIPTEWWAGYPSNLLRPVLFFDGLNIVNPFNQYWYQSAAVRVAELSIDFPEHRAKFGRNTAAELSAVKWKWMKPSLTAKRARHAAPSDVNDPPFSTLAEGRDL